MSQGFMEITVCLAARSLVVHGVDRVTLFIQTCTLHCTAGATNTARCQSLQRKLKAGFHLQYVFFGNLTFK